MILDLLHNPVQDDEEPTPVTTHAKLIRAERYIEIGTIIQRDATLLIETWVKRAVEEHPTPNESTTMRCSIIFPVSFWELGSHLASTGDPES